MTEKYYIKIVFLTVFMSSILIVKDWVLLTAGFYIPIFHSFVSFNGKEKSLLLTAFCERTTTMPTRHFWLNWVLEVLWQMDSDFTIYC